MKQLIFILPLLLIAAPVGAFSVSPTSGTSNITAGSFGNGTFLITPDNTTIFTTVSLSVSSPFQVSMPFTSVQLNNVVPVTFGINVPANFAPGTYKTFFTVTGTNITKVYTQDVTVPAVSSFTMNSTQNVTVEQSGKGYVFIPIVNTGNVIVDLNVTSNSSKLVPTNIKAYPGIVSQVPIFYDLSAFIGQYVAEVDINGGKTLVKFDVSDTKQPDMRSITFNDEATSLEEVLFTIDAVDNVGIDKVWMTFAGQTVFFTKVENVYTTTHVFKLLGDLPIEFAANDTSGNTLKVSKLLVLRRDVNVQFFDYTPLSLARGFKLSKTILNTPVPIPVNITMTNVSTPENSTFVLFVEGAPFGNAELLEGETIALNDVTGEMKLVFGGDFEGQYSANMLFEVPAYAADNKNIIFRTEVRNATILEDATYSFGDKTLKCQLNNTGFIETSEFVCLTTYPADVPLLKPPIPVTQEEYDGIVAKEEEKRKNVESELKRSNGLNLVLAVILGILAIVAVVIYIMKFTGIKLRK